ncbi:MAG: hypothetical protein RLO51_25965 [Thalassobaculum sp.]|uniref:hypothetical protein n=1 Tax=Thalassobaculum sp. TaxID=2022740 RepID=UPI0032EA952F
MSVALQRAGAGQPAARSAPHDLDDNALLERLVAVQARTRDLMRDFKIPSANISVMAWEAEQAIADTSVRAEFLRLLIDLHEFGRRARQRGLIQAPKARKQPEPESAPARPDDAATRLFASDEEGADTVSTDASQALFRFLDR